MGQDEKAGDQRLQGDYGDMVCFCGHVRRDHGASSELGAEFYRPDACLKCGALVCDEFQWNGGAN